LFLTSYQQSQLPDDLGDALVVEKPFNPTALVDIVLRLARGGSGEETTDAGRRSVASRT
jgi:hypothetical protein